MATYKDPVQCFAPLEVIERILEIREENGFSQSVFVTTENLADYLDAYGFDCYAMSAENAESLDYGKYQAPVVPGGDSIHTNITSH